MMMTNEILQQIPSIPSNPQIEGEGVKSTENPVILSISEVLPQHEGDEGGEGLAQKQPSEDVVSYTETFSDKLVKDDLPPLAQDVIDTQEDPEDQDSMLLGLIIDSSGCLPNTFGIYDQRRVYAPIFGMIYGPASSNKGILNASRWLLQPIEQDIEMQNLQEQEEYQRQMVEYLAQDKASRQSTLPPIKPSLKSLWIPANTSATACYQALSDNGGWGVTLETETDTLTQALGQDYGDFTDGLRKAFHHETISYRRRKENEFVMINEPRWAILLTATPGQIPLLFKSPENGTWSRFFFYGKRRRLVWRNVFAQTEKTLDEKFKEFGQRFKGIYDELLKRNDHPIQVIFSPEQQAEFNKFFEDLQLEQFGLYGDDLIASVRRLGLVCFRIAMVLTILRYEGSMPIIDFLSQAIVVDDRDFKTAMTISNCLINHTAHVYSDIFNHDSDTKTSSQIVKLSNQEKLLFSSLDTEFTTEDVRQTAKKLNIHWKTAERYLGKFVGKLNLAIRIKNGHYRKA